MNQAIPELTQDLTVAALYLDKAEEPPADGRDEASRTRESTLRTNRGGRQHEQPAPSYQPVPVDVAAQIAERFSKDIAIILTWDGLHNLVHTTTWGHSANDKLVAADAGETVAKARST